MRSALYPKAVLGGRLGPLRQRPFALFFFATMISGIGDWASVVALGYGIYGFGSATDVGIVFFAREIPTIILLLAGGVVADRFSRRIVIIVANLARMLGQAGIAAALFLSDAPPIPVLALFAAIAGGGAAFARPANASFVPRLVPKEDLQPANALIGLSRNTLAIVGTSAGAVLVAVVGAAGAIALDAATYLVAAILVWRIRSDGGRATRGGNPFRDLADGWREFTSRTWVWTMVTAFGISQFLLFPALDVLGPLIAKRDLGGASSLAAIVTAEALGTLAGGLAALRIRPRRPLLTAAIVTTPSPIVLLALANTDVVPLLAIAAFGSGFGLGLSDPIWYTTLQSRIPDDVLSRIAAYDWFGSTVMLPLGFVVIGPLADRTSPDAMLGATGGILMATTAALILVPAIRNLRSDDRDAVAPATAPPAAAGDVAPDVDDELQHLVASAQHRSAPATAARDRVVVAPRAGNGDTRPLPPPRISPSSPPQHDDGRQRSLWLREALAADSTPVDRLEGDTSADVCIVGGGFTGLWTAILVKEQDPACDVVVLERDLCGSGASGRNGGFAMSWWEKFPTLRKLGGTDTALFLAYAAAAAVDEIDRFSREHAIDCHFTKAGYLWTSTSAAQDGAFAHTVDELAAAGAQPLEYLDAAETARRTGSRVHREAVFDPAAATIQPALLARGLARVARELGVRVYERSHVQSIRRASPAVVRTARGAVSAEALVLAMNAWASALPEVQPSLVVTSSDIIATPPIPDRLDAIGWTDGVAISDSRRLVNYYRTTRDGRIAFGRGGGGLARGGEVGRDYEGRSEREDDVLRHLHRAYPMLADIGAALSWRGPIDYCVDGLPFAFRLPAADNVVVCAGFSGTGVSQSRVLARVCASLALRQADEWVETPLVRHPTSRLPPEPFRRLGGLAVKRAIEIKERIEDDGRRPHGLLAKVAALDPTSFADTGER